MFALGIGIGFIIGANIALILYAIILAGKDNDAETSDYISNNL